MVALLECGRTKTVPDILSVNCAGHLGGDGKVAALDGKIESRLGVLDEMKGDLGVTLLLQVSDNALTNKVTAADDLQDLVVVLSHKSKLEAVLCWVDRDRLRLGGTVKAVDDLTLDSGEVDRLFQRLDDTVVTVGQWSPCRSESSTYPLGRAYLMWLSVV